MGRAIRSIEEYREMAEECRASAKYQLDWLIRNEMLELANHWDEAARQMERARLFSDAASNPQAV